MIGENVLWPKVCDYVECQTFSGEIEVNFKIARHLRKHCQAAFPTNKCLIVVWRRP